MLKRPRIHRWSFYLLLAMMASLLGVLSWKRYDRSLARASLPSVVVMPALPPPSTATPSREPAAASDDRPAPALFSFVQPPGAAELNRALPAPTRAIHYVKVNTGLVAGKQSPFWQKPGAGRVLIPLPEGGDMVVTINHSEMLGPDRFTSEGQVAGRPDSRVLFAWNEGFLHASIEAPGLGHYALRAATSEVSQFYRIDPTLVPPCGGPRLPDTTEPGRSAGRFPPPEAARRASGTGDPAASPPPGPPRARAQDPQRAEVHVMMLYTPSVLPTMARDQRSAAVLGAFDLAVAKVNSAFEASLISTRVKLVRVAETDYDESGSGPARVHDDALTALFMEQDGRMDEIHAWRDEAGADIVCLALNRPDTESSGLSFLLGATDDPFNARFAFSVVHYANVGSTNVVAHELGHIFGCAHDRENALSGAGAFDFSYGYRFFGADGRQYHDIMSYPPGTELAYFSNPAIVVPAPVHAPIGIPAGQPGASNNALTIERTAFATAGYRLQTQAAASTGRLINVATRAFVGADDQVMIGGFVVQGTQPKRMLIRAAGPALRAFGVEEALADPVLTVITEGWTAAENDNWEQSIGPGDPALAPEIVTAAVQASAFAFPAGSADAAVLLTLPAGAYTAVVEGKDGATGQGLIEAYEMDRSASRIANLATRAFAGRDGRELVGGFVVEGTTGSTKRILIRVLGPTLGRPPFHMSGTLEDPEMEVRNADGELLFSNDDWSSGSEGGAGIENDFHPLVDLYGEKQIFATGFAPSNRREPGALVDLPPGSYTVTVRPYELRNPNPLVDQPAVPGVAVVEVYEILR